MNRALGLDSPACYIVDETRKPVLSVDLHLSVCLSVCLPAPLSIALKLDQRYLCCTVVFFLWFLREYISVYVFLYEQRA